MPNYRSTKLALREALAVRERRRVRRDTTVSVLGRIYELEQGFLAGRVVDIVYSYLDDPPQPEVEHEGKRYTLSPVDPDRQLKPRAAAASPDERPTAQAGDFDPSCTTRTDTLRRSSSQRRRGGPRCESTDLAWFGLRIAPFSKEIGDDDLWLPPSKDELVDDLAEAIEAHATVLLTGEPGVGKTCVLRALRRRSAADSFRLTYCHNATLGRRDFYRQLCLALGLTPSRDCGGRLLRRQHARRRARAKSASIPSSCSTRRTCFTRTCSTTAHPAELPVGQPSALSLVLVGLPELRESARAAAKSLALLAHPSPLRHRRRQRRRHRRVRRPRLKLAGADKSIFAADAIALMHEHATGALRDIDRLAHGAMRDAARRKRKTVDRDAVERVLAGRMPIA